MEKIKLAVYNEYALGYIMPERPDTFYTLKDSVLRGAPWRVMREPYFIGPNATVRLASRKDFEDFGLSFEGYDDPMYEFDTTLSHNRRTSNGKHRFDRKKHRIAGLGRHSAQYLQPAQAIR